MKLSANQFRTALAVPKGNDLTEQVKSDSHCIYMEKTKQKPLKKPGRITKTDKLQHLS